MSYSTDYAKSYCRCTIIRGKSQNEMDDLLPIYAGIVADICPIPKREFAEEFYKLLSRSVPRFARVERKTIDNHRTEVAGMLFGLYAIGEDGMVYATEACLKLLEDADQPAFFKNICLGFQFPNGAKRPKDINEDISKEYRLRPLCYVVKLLKEAEGIGLTVTKEDIAFYVLSHADVLRGLAKTSEVIAAMASDKAQRIDRKLCIPGKEHEFTHQHITEQLNLLELANILVVSSDTADTALHLNTKEGRIIDECIRMCDAPLGFDCYVTPYHTIGELRRDWMVYNGKLHAAPELLATEHCALVAPKQKSDADGTEPGAPSDTPPAQHINTVEFGDEGEKYVYEMERARVERTRPDLVNKVLLLGKTKGFGYDVLSVEAGEDFDTAELARHIEVKTTKRATAPTPDAKALTNYVHLTRKEWVAAQQHGEQYYIYIVFYSVGETTVGTIRNPAAKVASKEMQLVPLDYRLHYSGSCLTFIQD